jgi:hypothetical protein
MEAVNEESSGLEVSHKSFVARSFDVSLNKNEEEKIEKPPQFQS